MTERYPMRLRAACKDYLWGGTRLRTEYGQHSDAEKVAESWMLSAHPDGPSEVENGAYAGLTLPQVLQTAGPELCGTDCAAFPDFPVLVKLIDAKDSLSIQVHPDDAYARTHGGGFGKTEMWYIVDCDPGAGLYYGFDHAISREEFRRRIENNTLEEVLNRVPVHRGDVFFIGAGTLHAIGAGILIAEIQQSSNLTYRIYDFGRLGKDGKPRELHIAQALDVTRLERPVRPTRPQGEPEEIPGGVSTLLASCRVFTVKRLDVRRSVGLTAGPESFHSLLCLSGGASLLRQGKEELRLQKGASVFVPAGCGPYRLEGECSLLLTTV